MSIKLMTAVWAREDLTSTQKLVLLALADWSNDEGLSWPSIDQLMKKSSLKKRAVQITIRSLEESGFVRREEVTGKGNRYWIILPVHQMHPCTTCIPPVHQMHPTPASNAPNTSEIHQLNTTLICASDDAPKQPALIEDEQALSINDVVEAWNDTADKLGKPKVQRLSDSRKQVIRQRIKQNTLDDFVTVFRNIERSEFLRNWKGMGFDWVFKAGNFQKILEGNYNG